MQWGHSTQCACAICQSLPRIHLLIAKGTSLPGFVEFSGTKVRLLEAELRDALARKGYSEENLPAPPGFYKKFPELIALDSTVPPPPPAEVFAGSGQPADSHSQSSGTAKPDVAQEPAAEVRESTQEASQPSKEALPSQSSPRELLSCKVKAKPKPPSGSSVLIVKQEAEEKAEKLKSPVAEVDHHSHAPDHLKSSPKKEKKHKDEPARSSRQSRSQGRGRSPRKSKRSRSRRSCKGEARSPKREGGKERKFRPHSPDHPPPGRRPELVRRPREPSHPPAERPRGTRDREGPGWVGERPRGYKHWGKNKGVVKRAKQARRRDRRDRHAA